MSRREIIIYTFLVSWGLFGINLAAMNFYWYSSVWWFDMPMHFLGGVMLGFFFLLYAFRRGVEHTSFTSIHAKRIVLLVFLGTIAWELLEFTLFKLGGDPFYVLDAVSDIFFGVSGGTLVLFLHLTAIKEPVRV